MTEISEPGPLLGVELSRALVVGKDGGSSALDPAWRLHDPDSYAAPARAAKLAGFDVLSISDYLVVPANFTTALTTGADHVNFDAPRH